jgi:hypothetical protein
LTTEYGTQIQNINITFQIGVSYLENDIEIDDIILHHLSLTVTLSSWSSMFYLFVYCKEIHFLTSWGRHSCDLYLRIQSVPITTNVVSSNPIHDEVYSIPHYVIKFVCYLQHVGGFLHQYKLASTIYNWNTVESGIKYQ